jgi:hypothetical protein
MLGVSHSHEVSARSVSIPPLRPLGESHWSTTAQRQPQTPTGSAPTWACHLQRRGGAILSVMTNVDGICAKAPAESCESNAYAAGSDY